MKFDDAERSSVGGLHNREGLAMFDLAAAILQLF